MTRASIARTLVIAAACWTAGPASAQQASTIPEAEAGAAPSTVTTAPKETSEERWLQVDLEEASQRSRCTRNALIATSATFAAAITAVAFSWISPLAPWSSRRRVMWSPAIGDCGNHEHLAVEAVEIEKPGARPISTILERFRGQASMRTRPKNTSKTRYRTFL